MGSVSLSPNAQRMKPGGRKAYYEGVGHKTRRQCSRVRFGSFVQDHQARI